MGTHINSGNDLVTFLKGQHKLVKSLFETVITTTGEERTRSFYALRRLMAVHETVEEEIVHPAARRELPDGNAIVDARLDEENAAKAALTDLERLNADSPEFDAKIRTLRSKVLAHAEAEEQEEFARLGAILAPERLERMRKAAMVAESLAPTRPHPGMESAMGNLLIGPFVAMVDRTRDILSGKS
jgi:hemerythrin superfamily protein